MISDNPILEMRNISKAFAGVQALRDVSFTCKRGQVHAHLEGREARRHGLEAHRLGRQAHLLSGRECGKQEQQAGEQASNGNSAVGR